MRFMEKKSDRLENRFLPNSVCVECDCGEHFLFPMSAETITCPTCRRVEALPVLDEPPGPLIDVTPDNPENLALPPAQPFPFEAKND